MLGEQTFAQLRTGLRRTGSELGICVKVEMAVKNGLVKSGYDLKGAISQRQERTHGGKEAEKREKQNNNTF